MLLVLLLKFSDATKQEECYGWSWLVPENMIVAINGALWQSGNTVERIDSIPTENVKWRLFYLKLLHHTQNLCYCWILWFWLSSFSTTETSVPCAKLWNLCKQLNSKNMFLFHLFFSFTFFIHQSSMYRVHCVFDWTCSETSSCSGNVWCAWGCKC